MGFRDPPLPPRVMQWEKFSAAQSVANDTLTTITGWETTPSIGDPLLETMFNPTTGVWTPREPGTYLLSVMARFAASAVGYREVEVLAFGAFEGTGVIKVPSPGAVDCELTTFFQDNPDRTGSIGTSYNLLKVRHTAGGPLDVPYAILVATLVPRRT